MPVTYEPIATTTLGTVASSITFSSIAASWTDLRVVLYASNTTNKFNVRFRFNGDTGTNYDSLIMWGDGTTPSSGNENALTFNCANYSQGMPITPNYGLYTFDIMSYAGSTFKTTINTASEDLNGTGEVSRIVNMWESTSAINQITILTSGGNFTVGTTATIYGILKAQGNTMPATYKLISSNILSSTTASVTFSSIPSTYTDLVIRASVRSTDSGIRNIYLSANSITSNYSATQLRALDSTASSSQRTGDSSWILGLSVGSTLTSNTFSTNEWYIPNYAGSAYKVCSNVNATPNNSGSNQYDSVVANLLSNTAAITSLTLTDSGTGFASGSSFYLYGINNS